jgi:hypothetical protein
LWLKGILPELAFIWCARASYTAESLFELSLVLRAQGANVRPNLLAFKQVDFTNELV